MGIEIAIGALITTAITTAASVGLSIIAARLAPKPGAVERNKQSDIRIQLSEYGQPIPRVYGTFGNLAGQVVWATDIKESTTVTPGRGGKRRTPDVVSYTYSCSLMVLLCDCATTGPIQGIVEIYADDEKIYSGEADGNEKSINIAGASGGRIFLGKPDQLPSAKIEAERGVGKVPASRGMAGFELWDFVLDRYGNRIPNFTCKVVQGTTSVAQIIRAECRLAGLEDDEIDTAEINRELPGFFVTGLTPVRDSLEQLATAFQIDFVEVDGKVKALQRPHLPLLTIPRDDLGSYQESRSGGNTENNSPRLQISRRQDQEIPRRVEVSYYDPARSYERNAQSYGREVYGGDTVSSVTLNMALDADEADRIAKIIAITNWTERMPVKFVLPSDYLWLTPGDVATVITPDGEELDVRFEGMSFGTPSVIEVDSVRQIAEAYDQIGEGDIGQAGPTITTLPYNPGDTDPWLANVPPLLDRDAGTTGFYVAAAPVDASETWEGFTLYRRLGEVGQFQAMASITEAATIGRAVTALPGGMGLDVTSTVDIELSYGSLYSITDDDFLTTESVNLAVLGDEVFQFRDVMQPNPAARPNLYRLSYLERGLRGTAALTGQHQEGDRFVLVNSAVRRVLVNQPEIGVTYQFRAVTHGLDIDDVDDRPFTIEEGVQ